MLDARGAVTLLAERGLLDLSAVVDGDVRVVDASRRNRNLHVLRERGPSYVLKQGVGRERRQTVAHEACVYDYLASIDELVPVLPRVAEYVPADCLLVVELVEGGESLESRHARRPRFSTAYARRLAEALCVLHRATATEEAKARFPAELPWTLWGLHRPDLATAAGISNGNMLAIRMMQGTDRFGRLLDAAAAEWAPACLVHGDLRLDNCIVAGLRRRDAVRIVDWELAGWGDPCWDAGAVLGGYLSAWLLSCPISGETPLEAALELGRHRFADVQRAAGAFWAAYAEGMDAAPVALRRSMQFAGVHLLQTMFEELQGSAELTGRAVCLAQLAFNVLDDPDGAAEHFLALPIAA